MNRPQNSGQATSAIDQVKQSINNVTKDLTGH